MPYVGSTTNLSHVPATATEQKMKGEHLTACRGSALLLLANSNTQERDRTGHPALRAVQLPTRPGFSQGIAGCQLASFLL